MANPKNRQLVEDALNAELARDRTKTYVVEISPLGLVEMTRQNVTDGPREILTDKCPTCDATGVVVSAETPRRRGRAEAPQARRRLEGRGVPRRAALRRRGDPHRPGRRAPRGAREGDRQALRLQDEEVVPARPLRDPRRGQGGRDRRLAPTASARQPRPPSRASRKAALEAPSSRWTRRFSSGSRRSGGDRRGRRARRRRPAAPRSRRRRRAAARGAAAAARRSRGDDAPAEAAAAKPRGRRAPAEPAARARRGGAPSAPEPSANGDAPDRGEAEEEDPARHARRPPAEEEAGRRGGRRADCDRGGRWLDCLPKRARARSFPVYELRRHLHREQAVPRAGRPAAARGPRAARRGQDVPPRPRHARRRRRRRSSAPTSRASR